MSSKVLVAGVLSCASLMSACAPVAHRPLAAERTTVKSTDVIESVRQPELYAQINVSNVSAALGGGLIGALIDSSVNSSRASDAEGTVRPLRDALTGFDFDDTLKQDLSRELASVEWLAARGVTVNKDVTDKALDAILAKSDAGGVLFVTADYSLSPDFSKLHIKAMASLFPRGQEFRDAAKTAGVGAPPAKSAGTKTQLKYAAYYNTIAIETALPGAGTTLEANRDVWAANRGDKLRRALGNGSRQLAKLLAMDLNHRAPEKGAAPQGELHQEGMFKGRVVEQGPEGKLVRFDDGTVKYYAALADAPAPAATAAQ
jgi:hypothetical protein